MNESTIGENLAMEEALPPMCRRKKTAGGRCPPDAARPSRPLRKRSPLLGAMRRVAKPWDSSVNSYDGRTLGDFELRTSWAAAAKAWFTRHGTNRCKTVVAVKVMRHTDSPRAAMSSVSPGLYLCWRVWTIQTLWRILYAGESETATYFRWNSWPAGASSKNSRTLAGRRRNSRGTHGASLAEAIQCAPRQENRPP